MHPCIGEPPRECFPDTACGAGDNCDPPTQGIARATAARKLISRAVHGSLLPLGLSAG